MSAVDVAGCGRGSHRGSTSEYRNLALSVDRVESLGVVGAYLCRPRPLRAAAGGLRNPPQPRPLVPEYQRLAEAGLSGSWVLLMLVAREAASCPATNAAAAATPTERPSTTVTSLVVKRIILSRGGEWTAVTMSAGNLEHADLVAVADSGLGVADYFLGCRCCWWSGWTGTMLVVLCPMFVVRSCFLLQPLWQISLDMASAAEVVNDPVGWSFKLAAKNEALNP